MRFTHRSISETICLAYSNFLRGRHRSTQHSRRQQRSNWPHGTWLTTMLKKPENFSSCTYMYTYIIFSAYSTCNYTYAQAYYARTSWLAVVQWIGFIDDSSRNNPGPCPGLGGQLGRHGPGRTNWLVITLGVGVPTAAHPMALIYACNANTYAHLNTVCCVQAPLSSSCCTRWVVETACS